MRTVNATVTSKNQLTIPIKLVRKYRIDKNRSVTITDKGGVLEIRPQPALAEVMQPFWDEFARTHPNFPKLTGKDIHNEANQAYGNYFKKHSGV